MINTFGIKYIVEIQDTKQSEGMLAAERIVVRVHDDGAGAFLSLECENLAPDDEYGPGQVTLGPEDIAPLADALENIIGAYKADVPLKRPRIA